MSEVDQNSADRQIRELVVQIEGLRAMIRERESAIARIQASLASDGGRIAGDQEEDA